MRKIVYILSFITCFCVSYAALKTPAIEKKTGDTEILTLDARIDYEAPEKTPEQKEAEQLRKLVMAASSGNVQAQYELGNRLADGDKYGRNPDPQQAVYWWQKAASMGHAGAQCSLAILYHTGELLPHNQHKAAELWKSAAELGDTDAMFYIGVCYANGLGVMRDPVLAYQWWVKAAERGNERAQVNIGFCYARGEGVKKDISVAVKIWKKAAENGNTSAQCMLANCYYTGDGVKADPKKAVAIWTAAAEKGDAESMYYLANCYKEGAGGLSMDLDKFKYWIKRAAQNGNAQAKKILQANPAINQ